MEEDLILQQPIDRRLGNSSQLPPGPPGAESDAVEFDSHKAPPKPHDSDSTPSKSNRRRSPSDSPPPSKRKSPLRSRRSPSPINRRRRSPSPRRVNRFRAYSPDRRRYDSGRSRRSPIRRRSPPPRDRRDRGRGVRDRDRNRFRRGRSSSRSISRSPSPPRRSNGSGNTNNRWSPSMKKPASPVARGQSPSPPRKSSVPPSTHAVRPQQPPAQYGVIPSQMYRNDGVYMNTAQYGQYVVPPPQPGFVAQPDAYNMQPPVANFNTAYPPPTAWPVNDAYGQQTWMQPPVNDPNQITHIQQVSPTMPLTNLPPPNLQATQVPSQTPITTLAVTTPPPPDVSTSNAETNISQDVVAQEKQNQREEMIKQHSSYVKKTKLLKKELKMLKEQRMDLTSNKRSRSPSPTTRAFIIENENLQNQIEKKLGTIERVIEMLSGLLGNAKPADTDTDSDSPTNAAPEIKYPAVHATPPVATVAPTKKNLKSSSDTSGGSSSSSSSSSSGESTSEEEDDDDSLRNKVLISMRSKREQKDLVKVDKADDFAIKSKDESYDDKKRCNYVFYDPEMHWCQTCNFFPKTAKEFLNHLHTKDHIDREKNETPWHANMIDDQYPFYEKAQTKRKPIRGLTFFVPSTAWYCKLCNFWMGDLHCASTHLKSQLHSKKYDVFLEQNPNFEANWLADRERSLNSKKEEQSKSTVAPTSNEGNKKSKKDNGRTGKKRKKSAEKKDRKKKKRGRKSKKNSSSDSSSSSESSSSDNERKFSQVVKDLDNPNPAASIRVAMRKHEPVQILKPEEESFIPPPPPPKITVKTDLMPPTVTGKFVGNKFEQISPHESLKSKVSGDEEKPDDSIIQQWNQVQPVISESEKKLFEQLKGKLKSKPQDEVTPPAEQSVSSSSPKGRNAFKSGDKENRTSRRSKSKSRPRRDVESNSRRRRSRSRSASRDNRNHRDNRVNRDNRDNRDNRRRRRSRSLSRDRRSPRAGGWRGRRRRTRSRSRSRSARRRSRSIDRRRRTPRSRTRSRSRVRIEKAIVKHSEFRPRVPEKDKEREKEKKRSGSRDKKDSSNSKKSKTSSTVANSAAAAAAAGGKKLPFIGKMPVFKKQNTGQSESNGEKHDEEGMVPTTMAAYQMHAAPRPPAPTAAQIQMAMMEDVYGNAPPFHPDAGVMVDYDDLMPDPVQFVNLMGHVPPPPPPGGHSSRGENDEEEVDDDADILPPGIDEEESEEFIPKPITDGPISQKGPLPKDLEDALNIIFPGEKKEEDVAKEVKKSNGETQIIVDEPVMQAADLVKEGIHILTLEETSVATMEEGSQLSMNEPLIFNKVHSPSMAMPVMISSQEDASSQNAADIELPQAVVEVEVITNNIENKQSPEPDTEQPEPPSSPQAKAPSPPPIPVDIPDIPMPDAPPDTDAEAEVDNAALLYNLEDIPQPPPPLTESEKKRRQEELDDLAMLGIDADDMAAQCM